MKRLSPALALSFSALACGGAAGSSDAKTAEANDCLIAQFREDPAAPKMCTASCEGANAEACTTLGTMYERGHLVPADPAQALARYTRGCELGDPVGCHGAALQHEKAGTLAEATRFHERACTVEGGTILPEKRAAACFSAGDAYHRGDGVAKDPKKAEDLLRRACKAGNIQACDRFDFKPKL